jgi:hypothetical protein
MGAKSYFLLLAVALASIIPRGYSSGLVEMNYEQIALDYFSTQIACNEPPFQCMTLLYCEPSVKRLSSIHSAYIITGDTTLEEMSISKPPKFSIENEVKLLTPKSKKCNCLRSLFGGEKRYVEVRYRISVKQINYIEIETAAVDRMIGESIVIKISKDGKVLSWGFTSWAV